MGLFFNVIFMKIKNNNIFLLTILLIVLLSASLGHAITFNLTGFPTTEEELFEQEEFLAQLMGQDYKVYYGHVELKDLTNKTSCLNASLIYSINNNEYAGAITLKGEKKTYKKTRHLTFTGKLINNEIDFSGRDKNIQFEIATIYDHIRIAYGNTLECATYFKILPIGHDTLSYMLKYKSDGLLPLPLKSFSNLVTIEDVDTEGFTGGTIVQDDNEGPEIITDEYFVADDNYNANIAGRVIDQSRIGEVTIDTDRVKINESGEFNHQLYVSFMGNEVEIVAIDKFGNRSTKLVRLERQKIIPNRLAALNPSKIIHKNVNENSAALIIGIEKYEWTFDAPFAKNDAKLFHDFAVKSLGVPEENIETLINDEGKRLSAKRLLRNWLPQVIEPGKTNFYLYFSGHGLASEDDLFLLPYDGDPAFLEDSALTREEIFTSINKHEPLTVVAFLDTCYSGSTRANENLLGARPIAIEVQPTGIPNNFTVFTASANNEIANSLEPARHGMFSYFMMKGLQGEADVNEDQKITTGELHAYLLKKCKKKPCNLRDNKLRN